MKRVLGILGLVFACSCGAGEAAVEVSVAVDWPRWRGPLDTGEAPGATPPHSWSETENVRWKVALPGKGHSSPIVVGERVFVTSAVPVGEAVEPAPERAPGAHDNAPVTHVQAFVALALRRSDGERLWERTLVELLPHERAHVTASYASASPVSDGAHVWVSFGSYGLACLTVDGDVLWQSDLGDMQAKHAHGEGASPTLFGDTLVVNWDHEGQSFVVALDKLTGEERWRVARDEVTSWSTPIVVEHAGRAQLIVSGSEVLRSYDLANGDVLWECGGSSRNVVASPVSADGVVYAGSSYGSQALLAIRLEGASGDLARSDNLLWMRRKNTPYVPSPLLTDGALWFLHHYQGTLSRLDPATGAESTGPFRLPLDNVYASPVAAAGRIYLTDLEGATVVLSNALEPEVLAINRLDESFSASAAIAGNALWLRGETFLYCLSEE